MKIVKTVFCVTYLLGISSKPAPHCLLSIPVTYTSSTVRRGTRDRLVTMQGRMVEGMM